MYYYKLTVRGNELDSFRHVNNSVYLNYLEQARWEILKEKNMIDYFSCHELLLAVTEMNVKYIREAKLFDALTVETEILKEAPYLVFKQIIKNDTTQLVVLKANVKTLLVDGERIPHDIPDVFITK